MADDPKTTALEQISALTTLLGAYRDSSNAGLAALDVLKEAVQTWPGNTPPPPPPPPPPSGSLEPVNSSVTQSALAVRMIARQTFDSFGWSQPVKTTPPMDLIKRNAEHLFEGLNTKLVRLWCHPLQVGDAINKFVGSGFIKVCKERGVDRFLMGPEAYTPGNPGGYARTLANALKSWVDGGIPVTHTGVQNEPGSAGRAAVPAGEAVELYQTLKSELAAKGIGHIKILAPEFASADSLPNAFFDAVKKNGAVTSIDLGAHHSYNMAATPQLYDQRWMTVGKGLAQTEAGSGGIPSTGARFCNDLNYGAELWVFFIGQANDAGDASQKLVDHNGNRNPWWYVCMAINRAMPRGTRMRLVSGGHLGVYTYGVKPKLTAAAGIRPDGKWCVMLQNGTWGSFTDGGFGHHGAETLQVTVTIPDLNGQNGGMNGWRVPGSGRAGAVIYPIVDGQIRVTLPAAHLVTLVGE